MIPAMTPMTIAAQTLTKAQGAVMATRPARAPLTVMLKSGFPCQIQAVSVAASRPAAQDMLVVTTIWEIETASAAIVLPGLKPNQPSQRIKPPRKARAMLWPGMACTLPSGRYFPKRGPSNMMPARPAQPPIE